MDPGPERIAAARAPAFVDAGVGAARVDVPTHMTAAVAAGLPAEGPLVVLGRGRDRVDVDAAAGAEAHDAVEAGEREPVAIGTVVSERRRRVSHRRDRQGGARCALGHERRAVEDPDPQGRRAQEGHVGEDVVAVGLPVHVEVGVDRDAPDARLWSFQLGNLWAESIDYVNHTASLNGDQAFVNGDGRVRIVVAHEDPGVPNWLDTAGHPQGAILFRYQQTKTQPTPETEVVDAKTLRERLPGDTPTVTSDERAAEIAARRRHATKRWSP